MIHFIAETEKAVLLTVVVDDYRVERFRKRRLWFPKSQIDAEGVPRKWITETKLRENFDFQVLEFYFEDADEQIVEPWWNRCGEEHPITFWSDLKTTLTAPVENMPEQQLLFG